MLCSFLIPSRKRISKLMRAIQSVLQSADGASFEILIRLEEDDADSIARGEDLCQMPGVSVFVGPAMGYKMIGPNHFTFLASIAKGSWVWIMNDDMTLSREPGGLGWDTLLETVPKSGYYVEPFVHKLNNSIYPQDNRCGGAAFIRNCWQSFGMKVIPTDFDYAIPKLLEARGWKPWFLDGITLWHDRDEKEIILRNKHERKTPR